MWCDMQTRRFIKLEFKIKAPLQRCFCLWRARHSAHKLLRIFMLGDATYRLTGIFTTKISFTALSYLHFTCIIFVYEYYICISMYKNFNAFCKPFYESRLLDLKSHVNEICSLVSGILESRLLEHLLENIFLNDLTSTNRQKVDTLLDDFIQISNFIFDDGR